MDRFKSGDCRLLERTSERNKRRNTVDPQIPGINDAGAGFFGQGIMIGFAGDLKIIFVIKRGEESYEVLKDAMLPPEIAVEELYHTACENLVRDVEFVIGNTWYGGFGIIADGVHEASSVCFRHIWQVCADKLKDDLVIYVPHKDTVIFAPASQQKVVEQLRDHAKGAYEAEGDKISLQPYFFSKERKELTTYEN